jgi:hypothetical protein
MEFEDRSKQNINKLALLVDREDLSETDLAEGFVLLQV